MIGGSISGGNFDGIDHGYDSGMIGSVLDAVDSLILKPASAAAILGITPPGIN